MQQKETDLFLDMMAAEKGASEQTLAAYRHDLNQFFEFFGKPADQIHSEDISGFMQNLAKRFYSPKTQARKLSALKEFCRFLYTEHIISDNPAQNVYSPKQEKPLPKFLTKEQILLMIEKAQKHSDPATRRIGVMISLMFATGLRVSELVSLPLNAVNFDRRQIFVRGKGQKERIVPIAHNALDQLHDYIDYRKNFIAKNKISPWLFPSKNSRSGHICRNSFWTQLKKLAAEAGLNPAIISPHTLRHSFATNLIKHDADLRSVQKMLGHESIATTEIYTHITSEDLLLKISRNHPLSRFHIRGKDHD